MFRRNYKAQPLKSPSKEQKCPFQFSNLNEKRIETLAQRIEVPLNCKWLNGPIPTPKAKSINSPGPKKKWLQFAQGPNDAATQGLRTMVRIKTQLPNYFQEWGRCQMTHVELVYCSERIFWTRVGSFAVAFLLSLCRLVYVPK